ncbi:MAG: transglutaminase-like domain-containing protein [Oscillospiraceae bacterium]
MSVFYKMTARVRAMNVRVRALSANLPCRAKLLATGFLGIAVLTAASVSYLSSQPEAEATFSAAIASDTLIASSASVTVPCAAPAQAESDSAHIFSVTTFGAIAQASDVSSDTADFATAVTTDSDAGEKTSDKSKKISKKTAVTTTASKEKEKSATASTKTVTEKNKTVAKQPVSASAKERLNAVALSPDSFLKGEDEKILQRCLNKICTDDMSNYDKALACYDYLIENTYYDYGGWSDKIRSVLVNGYGTCTEYSYVYAAMLRYLGFDAATVSGSTHLAAGGFGEHTWVEATLDGTVYVFDPQVDDNMSGGSLSHARFCKTYDEVSGKYRK